MLLWGSWVAQGVQGDMGGCGCVEVGAIGAVGLQLWGVEVQGVWERSVGLGCWLES